jgi:hypothetical protein
VQREPQLRDRRRGRLDPGRRGPHAADHLGPAETRPTSTSPRSTASRRLRRDLALRGRREGAPCQPHRGRHRALEQLLGVRTSTTRRTTSCCTTSNQALRAHVSTSATRTTSSPTARSSSSTSSPAARWRAAAGATGCTRPSRPRRACEIRRREPDARDDHVPELLPHVRQAGRHDRHRDTEAEEFHEDLQPRRRRRSRPTADDPRNDQDDLVYKNEREQVRRVVDEIKQAHERGQPVLVGTTSSRSRRSSTLLTSKRHPARGAEREAARARGRDRRPGGPQGRGHRRHEHGRPRHRHHARRQPEMGSSSAPRASTRQATPSAVRGAAPVQARVREGEGRGQGARRSVHRRHRAPRVPPHRQPAPRPRRPPGRPGRARASSSRSRTT